MKKSLVILWGLLLFTGLLITGCKKDSINDPNNQTASDEISAIKQAAMADQFVNNNQDEQTFADQKIAPTDYDETFAKTDSAITPLRWGRFITSVTSNVTVTTQGDTVSVAKVERTVTGVLKIMTSATDTLSKPFVDKSVRNVIFRRIARDTKYFWKNWIPVATTLVQGGTDPAPANDAIAIAKVELIAGSNTLTITDPQNFWLRYHWLGYMMRARGGDLPDFHLGDSVRVQVTVQSQSPDTDIVALRHGFDVPRMTMMPIPFRRVHMTLLSQTGPDQNGFYTKVYERAIRPGFGLGSFHIGVDAMTRSTLYDNAAPYSVSWWGVPFRAIM